MNYPDFRLPFLIGVAVSLTTYRGHNPDDKKVDFFAPAGSAVVASLAGRVHEWVDPGGVEINHGNGWFTLYLHMTNRVPVGTVVIRGQRIGTISNVGTGAVHLHYEQLFVPGGGRNAGSEHIVNPMLQGTGPIVMDPAHAINMTSTNDPAIQGDDDMADELANLYGGYYYGGTSCGEPVPAPPINQGGSGNALVDLVQHIRRQADATLAAVEALTAGGTSVDTAAVIDRINAVAAQESAAIAELRAELVSARAETVALRTKLAAAAQAEADKLKG